MRAKAIIHLDRYKKNMDSIKARVGHDRFICVSIKANAYGHGALEIARVSLESGASHFGIAMADEGIELRKGGINTPILLLSQSHPDEIQKIIQAELTPFISDAEFASALNEQAAAAKTKVPVHIKIDTGMGRIGCPINEALSLTRHIDSCTWLQLTGTSTHLASSDSANIQDIDYTKTQLTRFKEAITAIKAAGINPGIIHAANSGAIIQHPDSWFDMVRPGILLYGYKTAQENELPAEYKNELSNYTNLMVKPVMELRSTVALIKKITKGESVSYGRTWTADQDTYIGILPIGYADGLPRLVSNKWQAVINGKTYPLVGRVCMDQCCVNLGRELNVQRWDEAIIFGGSAPDAGELASVVGTIPYEITCNISGRVPRVYV